MRGTLVASDAMTGLSQFRYTAVVAYKESASCFFVVFTCLALRNIPFVDTLVIVQQDGRDVQAGISMPYGQGMQYLQSLQGMVGYCIISCAVSSRYSLSSSVSGTSGE